ncbi:hypothetical protein JMA_22130 [Jeotgalibacillus malaysiensis]|uniref:Siphovirus-type tail component RIFT-related domain-containing protein n=1 Tax=Jeotgalibacillus malaysiensis TaxID=1508404 RepID=A0A0B5AMK9_9BACL|nr:distal tail protein Dit [Jeotgalibacillus malaysiensis]AJD91530.1 hypothetical protein JMA_22130 [Jeotgalibacillus malaysiensis]
MFTFNQTNKSYLYELEGRSRKVYAPRNHELIKVPGLAGAIITDETVDVIYHEVPVGLNVTEDEYEDVIRELQLWLLTSTSKELRFHDEPTFVWRAKVTGSLNFTKKKRLYEGTITFICADPQRYGFERDIEFENGAATVINNGSIEAQPILTADVLQDITHLDLFTGQAYMRLGQEAEVGEQPVEEFERVETDTLASLANWSVGGTTDGGAVAGNFTIRNGAFAVSSFGTGSGWHGPSVLESIAGGPLQDFQAQIRITFPTIQDGIGRAEMYLLDDQNKPVVKVAMKKTGGGAKGNTAEVILINGSDRHTLVNYATDNGRAWNNFSGLLQVERRGNVWSAYIAQVDPVTYEHHTRYRPQNFTDVENRFMNQVAVKQLHAAQSGTLPVPDMTFYHLFINKINEVVDNSPVIIARAGDQIIFNHMNKTLTINGEDAKRYKDFGATYFGIPKGESVLLIAPADKVSASLRFREAYL